MASTPQTRGFQVSVMPSVQLADPRGFDPYSPIVSGLGAGTNIAGGLQNIILNRQRQNLADAQEARVAEAAAYQRTRRPVQAGLEDLQLKVAQATAPRKIAEARLPIENQTGTFIDIDEDGNEVQYGMIEFVDPVTEEKGTFTGRPLKTLRTKAQIATDEAKAAAAIRSADALANQRSTGRFEYANVVDNLRAAEEAGDAELVKVWSDRLKALNTKPGTLAPGTVASRRIEQLAVDAGVTMAQAAALSQTQEGLAAMQKLAARNTYLKTKGYAADEITLAAEEQAALDAVANLPQAGAAAAPAVRPAGPAAIAAPVQPAPVAPPPAAIQMLRSNPALSKEFDMKYGAGSAAQYLRG